MVSVSLPPPLSGLTRPTAYDHPVTSVECLETHISWILLTGRYAYKIKKPVDFGFLDFSSLEKRHHFCEEELRLNRQLAPELYLEVVPISADPGGVRMGGNGAVIEYAVKMHQFPGDRLLDRLATEHRLQPRQVERLAEKIAAFHAATPKADAADEHGLPHHIQQAVEQNFISLYPLLESATERSRLDRLHAWCDAAFARLQRLMETRKANGFVRECHGDLHLGNIVLIDESPLLFDRIEFSEQLRWIDVISELAFLIMDLEVRGLSSLANRAINRYLEVSGDYPGLVLLPYYQSYRAMVRAKITRLTLAQNNAHSGQDSGLEAQYQGYIALAEDYSRPRIPLLIITHGFSGSGKSWVSAGLSETLGLIHLRSDIERKRLTGTLGQSAAGGAALLEGIYRDEVSQATYRRLYECADQILRTGIPVILDATFLKQPARLQAWRIAREAAADFLILDLQAPQPILEARIQKRLADSHDPSDATLEVLKHQQASAEALSQEETALALRVDSGKRIDFAALAEQIRQRQPN